MTSSHTEEDPLASLDRAADGLAAMRQRPLLLLFYPDGFGEMHQHDVPDVYRELRAAGVSREARISKLDVLVHTFGGDPHAGYRLAQVIRRFAHDVVFLVPEHAYSAGTLLTLAGDEIELGDYAGLSPIDITVVEHSLERPRTEIELTSIDFYMEFAEQARERIERLLIRLGSPSTGSIDSDLLQEMVRQVGALKLGEYFRGRHLMERYAEELLRSYMFRAKPAAGDRIKAVIKSLLHEAPSHDFHMDFHLCRRARLQVSEMELEISDASKVIVGELNALTARDVICPSITDTYKPPFIRFCELPQPGQEVTTDAATTAESAGVPIREPAEAPGDGQEAAP